MDKPTMDDYKKDIKQYMDENDIDYMSTDTKKDLLDKIEDVEANSNINNSNDEQVEIKKVVVKVKNISRQTIDWIKPSEEKQVSKDKANKLIDTGGFIML